MKPRSILAPAGVLALTVGGALIAIQQAGQATAYDAELKRWGTFSCYFGLLLLICAGMVQLVTIGKLGPYKKAALLFKGKVTYEVEQAAISDLDFLYTKYEDMFGTDLVPKEEFARWMIRNPKICFKVIRVVRLDSNYSTKIVGFFDFEPLTTAALNRLLKTKPSEIPRPLSETDIRTAKSPAKGYYIGSIGATSRSRKDRAATLLWTLDFAHKLNTKNSVTLFANPFTDDGLRLCETFGFIPLNADRRRGLWKLTLPAGTKIPEYEDKLKRMLLHEV